MVPNSDDSRSDGTGGQPARHEVVVRRSPRYFRFIALGGILGILATLILTFAFPEQPNYSRGQVFGFVGLICVTIGIALGAVVAILVDRLTTRRAHTITMQALPTEPVEFAVLPKGDRAQDAAAREELTDGSVAEGNSAAERSAAEAGDEPGTEPNPAEPNQDGPGRAQQNGG